MHLTLILGEMLTVCITRGIRAYIQACSTLGITLDVCPSSHLNAVSLVYTLTVPLVLHISIP